MAPRRWSASRIDVANYCKTRYWLRYVEKKEPLRLSAYVKGSLLHEVIEKFWTRLGTPEEVSKKSSGKKYYDAETFAKYTQGKWKRIIIADSKAEGKIYWSYEAQKWVVLSELESICMGLFNHLSEEGPPLFSELKFKFQINDWLLNGRIDEVRLKPPENKILIVRDYKSGKPWMGEMKLDFNPQLTLYGAAIGSLCFNSEEFAKKINMQEKMKNFMGNKYWIDPETELQFFMIEEFYQKSEKKSKKNPPNENKSEGIGEKTKPNPIFSSHRTDQHFHLLLDSIRDTEIAVKTRIIAPEYGRKCDSCDMKIHCKEIPRLLQEGKRPETKTGQYSLEFALPSYYEAITPQERLKQELAEIKKNQGRLRLRRNFKKKKLENENQGKLI